MYYVYVLSHIVTRAIPGWTELASKLLPGGHAAVLADEADAAIDGRNVGLELRDTILIMRGAHASFAFLFRKPLSYPSLVEQVLGTQTGGLNVEVCRIGELGRWPANLVLIHHPNCQRQCDTGCVVRMLDEQTGELQSGAVASHHMRNNSKHLSAGGYRGGLRDMPLMGYGDSGGGSRFYTQLRDENELFEWLTQLIYVPLTSA